MIKFNLDNIKYDNHPFDHWVMDDFLNIGDAKDVSSEFVSYNDPNDIVQYIKSKHSARSRGTSL